MGAYRAAVSLLIFMITINALFTVLYPIFKNSYIEQQDYRSAIEPVEVVDELSPIRAGAMLKTFFVNLLTMNKEIWDFFGFDEVYILPGTPINLSLAISTVVGAIVVIGLLEFVRGIRY